jgi:hypothetical protein
MLAVLVAMLVTGQLPLHATLWQFALFWAPWMTLNLAASAMLCRGQASLWDGSYSTLLTTGIFARAAFVLVHPFRSSFKVTPKDGIDDGGWSAVRQLRLVLAMAVVLVVAIVVRSLGLAGLLSIPPLHGLAVVAGLTFAAWELTLVGAALIRVSRRHQVRHHYRVPVEVAGVVNGALVRVVDLTAGGAGLIGGAPIAVGSEVGLQLDLPGVNGAIRGIRVTFTICSCRPADGLGWRMGGTLTPLTEADGDALIEHCHVVSSRTRLQASGRLLPSAATAGQPGAEERAQRHLSAHA